MAKHAIARGASRELAAMVDGSSAILDVTDKNAKIDVVARYRGQPLGTEKLLFAAILSAGAAR